MDDPQEPKHKAHLFTLRVWAVENGTTAPQWRSRLQNIQSGEVHFCRDLEGLLAYLESKLNELHTDPFQIGFFEEKL